jgi:hypothetical protein
MNHVILHAGLDPASKLFGFCWLDQNGDALEPVQRSSGEFLYGFVTLRGTKEGKANRNARLDQIEDALWSYIRTFPVQYFAALNAWRADNGLPTYTWEIGSFCIEQPADNYFSDKHQPGKPKTGNRHDTMFVNGMSYRMAYGVARGYGREIERTQGIALPIYEVEPAISSSLINLERSAKKWQRCSQAAIWSGGGYQWPGMELFDEKERMKRSGEGWCVGGRLHGANADALDAFAAARAGFHFYQSNKLHNLALQTSKGVGHARPKPTRRTAR